MNILIVYDSFFGNTEEIAKAIKQNLKQTLWIGPSSTYHLWQGPQATRRAVRTVFSTFGKTGIILSPAVSAHCIMPWESTMAMIDEWKKRRR
jgi:flavorubredoxin